MKPIIDESMCIGCGLCVSECPEVFEMPADKAVVKGEVPAGKEDAAKSAAAACPVQCINI